MTTLYLASGSPRRQELLTQLGLAFERLVPGIEEQRQPQESAQHYVVRLAREKAQAGVAGKQARQHGNFHKRWRNGRLIYRKASGLSWLWALSVRCATMRALIFSAVCAHALSVLWSE